MTTNAIFLLAIGSFFLLFFLSRKLMTKFFLLFFLLTKNKSLSMHLLALIFLPGTFIHEFSHLLIAIPLGVRVGKLTLLPNLDEGGNIRAGSVMVEKSDPFRGTVIGLAPVIVGLTLVAGAGWLDKSSWVSAFYWLFLFEVGNTLFTSRSDMHDAVVVFLLGLVIILPLYASGVRIYLSLPDNIVRIIIEAVSSVSVGLVKTAIIDIIFITVLQVLLKNPSS